MILVKEEFCLSSLEAGVVCVCVCVLGGGGIQMAAWGGVQSRGMDLLNSRLHH